LAISACNCLGTGGIPDLGSVKSMLGAIMSGLANLGTMMLGLVDLLVYCQAIWSGGREGP
jgi:hypothetical protein